MWGNPNILFCSVGGNFAWQERQEPNAIAGPRCHLSSLRLQEMDVLHFAAHNIGRGNQSTPQRASVAVLKLSIVSALASVALFWGGRTYQGPHRWKGWGVGAGDLSLRLLYCKVAVAWKIKSRNLVKWQWHGSGLRSQYSMSEWDDRRSSLSWEKWFRPAGFSTLLKFMFEHYYTVMLHWTPRQIRVWRI